MLREMEAMKATAVLLSQRHAISLTSCLAVVDVVAVPRRGAWELWQAVSDEMTIASC
jgi:hypothetical protein